MREVSSLRQEHQSPLMRIVDYIVVHEMAHMTEKNHTPEFWHIIGLILPDYETRKEWLDKNGKYFSGWIENSNCLKNSIPIYD
jgi:hypothetical protein